MRQTIKQLLHFASNKIDKLDSEVLLSHTIKKRREYILAHPETKIDFYKKIKFKNYINRRKNNEPVAYITGHKEFFELDFVVNKFTLVPRPDTEIIVEEALKEVGKNDYILIDVGTGSGCIPISILKNKNIQAYATDISKNALKIAKKNAKKHNVSINFLHGNLLEPFIKLKKQKQNILITANLPYLTEEQFSKEVSISHEPKLALVTKEQGLFLYKELLKQLKDFSNTVCFFEIDLSQTKKIKNIIKEFFPKSKIEFIKDLSGKNRVVKINL
jgi:release factor glutamine methyltransferase